jgi:tripartite-type tricarboxylate transporter receptor subunit TctC
MKLSRRFALAIHLLLSAALAAVAASGASAQSAWPSRPIKLIVPTGPGAATDVMARLLADGMSRSLGQPVVVENMPGAAGIIAHQTAARAAPDGYTFLFSNTSGLASNLISFKSLPYDPTKDFTPVAMVCDLGPQSVSVNAELPVKTVPELIAYAKTKPEGLSYAVDVTAGAAPFAARLLNKRASLNMIEVPYRSAAQMMQDVASGINPVLISSIAAANAMVQAGKIRRIAITSSKRFPGLPDLPTANESVLGVIMDGWFVVVAPANTSSDIVNKVNQSVEEFLKSPDIRQRLIAFGLATSGADTPQNTGAFIKREQERWRALAQELGVEPQ